MSDQPPLTLETAYEEIKFLRSRCATLEAEIKKLMKDKGIEVVSPTEFNEEGD